METVEHHHAAALRRGRPRGRPTRSPSLSLCSTRTVRCSTTWDYRDTTGIYDDGSADKWGLRAEGEFALLAADVAGEGALCALTGQQYDAPPHLSLAPDAAVAARLLLLPD